MSLPVQLQEPPIYLQVPEPKEELSPHLAVPGVYFICPLTGVTLRRDQRDAHIKEAILSVSARAPASGLSYCMQGIQMCVKPGVLVTVLCL